MLFKKKHESEAPEAVSSAAAPPVAASAGAGTGISPEIVAVIAAAIAAMAGSESANGLIIRKISRIHGEKVSWSNAGLMECIDSRRF